MAVITVLKRSVIPLGSVKCEFVLTAEDPTNGDYVVSQLNTVYFAMAFEQGGLRFCSTTASTASRSVYLRNPNGTGSVVLLIFGV